MKNSSPRQINDSRHDSAFDEIDDLLLRLWQKNLPTIRQRLDLLDQLGSAAASGKLEEPARVEALRVAHNLAGSLGMYGYDHGTRLARQLELLLDYPTPDPTQIRTLASQLRQALFPTA